MIGRDTIDRIRARIDLVALVGETVKLQRRGRSHVGLCPFHQEKSPSFSVSDTFFHCFGCKQSGDCYKFLELTEGLSFIEAVRRLAEKAGIEIVDERSDVDRAQEQRARKLKDDLYSINSMAAAWFEKMIVDHPLASFARDELARRGLAYDGEASAVLRSFKIGYAPHGWDGLANYFRQQGVSPAAAEQVGLLAPRTSGSGYYDAFRHRLMVAILDAQGRVVAFSGRALKDPPDAPQKKDAQPPPKYVNSRESPIYSKGQTLFGLFQARNAIRTKGEAVIVEGNFDLVAMHARGIEHVVAPMGTAFTDDQARLLRRFAPSVVLLFDADAAGRKATIAARATLKKADLAARVARLPQGKDPDEFLQARGAQAMLDVLKAARALDEFLIDLETDALGHGSNVDEVRAALARIRPILDDQEVNLRDRLAKRAAERLGIDPPTLWRLMKGAHPDVAESTGESARGAERVASGPTGQMVAKTHASDPRAASEEERLSRAIVEAILVCPEVLDPPHVEGIEPYLALVTGDWAFALVEIRREMRNSRLKNRIPDLPSVLAQLPQSIQEAAAAKLADPVLETTYASAMTSSARDSMKLAAEILSTTADGRPDPLLARRKIREDGVKLEKAVAHARYREIQREIDRAESTGDFDKASALLGEKNRLMLLLRKNAEEARNDRPN